MKKTAISKKSAVMVQDELFRRMSAEEKIALASNLYALAELLSPLKSRHEPTSSAKKIRRNA